MAGELRSGRGALAGGGHRRVRFLFWHGQPDVSQVGAGGASFWSGRGHRLWHTAPLEPLGLHILRGSCWYHLNVIGLGDKASSVLRIMLKAQSFLGLKRCNGGLDSIT